MQEINIQNLCNADLRSIHPESYQNVTVEEVLSQYKVVTDEETERAEKLQRYFEYFNVENRYKMSFKEFVGKVESGTWQPYLAS